MRLSKILILTTVLTLVLAGCDLKVNITPKSNSNLNEAATVNLNAETNANVEANTNAALNTNESLSGLEGLGYELVSSAEGSVSQIKNNKTGEIVIENLKDACQIEVMLYAKPGDSSIIIFKPFNPGSDRPVKDLYSLNLDTKGCKKLVISNELGDFGALILSPNQARVAAAFETNEAKELKVFDLVTDSSQVVATLAEGETLNGGYGGLSNHFDIKWIDDETLQYTVYEDTVKNYDANAPEQLEKVLQVRVVKVE